MCPSIPTCHGLSHIIIYFRTQNPLLPGSLASTKDDGESTTATETNQIHEKERAILWDERLTSNLKEKNDDILQSVIILTPT